MTTSFKNRNEVLVVSEDEMLRDLICLCLEDTNKNIVPAKNAKEALQLISLTPESFEILITDNQMTGLSGVELILLLREKDLSLKKIILTSSMVGYSPELSALASLENKVTLLKKPFTPNELLQLIK